MKLRFFDFEVLPNWWLCVFGDLDTDNMDNIDESWKDKCTYVHSDMTNARDLLLEKMREKDYVMCGYNCKNYDLVIANAIYQGFTPQQIKIINDIIINPGCAYETKDHIILAPFAKRKISGIVYQDMLDDGAGSLKEKEATLGLSVLESSVDFNKENLNEYDKADLIYYCKQDVYATMMFYKTVVHPYTLVKLHMGKRFNIPVDVCHKSTNAKLVALALGARRSTFADEDADEIQLPSKIRNYCYDNLPSNIIDRVRKIVKSDKEDKGLTIKLFDSIVVFGSGGIHSTYCGNFDKSPCLYCESDDEWVLVNVDASSYYPSEMIQFNLLSRAVRNPQVFRDIFDERIYLKTKENPTPEEVGAQKADKLVLNTTFGASGNKWLDLYDPYMCVSVCKTGQIFLAALANKIHTTIVGSKIIQTNTDGILCYLRRKDLPVLDKLQKEWSDVSGINMERDFVKKIWQRDVNNYLLVKETPDGDKVKRKGLWLNDDYLRPGYVLTASANAFVCAKAVQRFLIYGEDIVENVVNNKNIKDFCISCTKGPTYRGVIQRTTDGDIQLFKANRVVATKDQNKGKLYKYKMYKGNISYTQMPSTPEHCLLVNDDLSHYKFDDIAKELDYMYYITRCADLLDMDWYHLKGTDLKITDRFNYFD